MWAIINLIDYIQVQLDIKYWFATSYKYPSTSQIRSQQINNAFPKQIKMQIINHFHKHHFHNTSASDSDCLSRFQRTLRGWLGARSHRCSRRSNFTLPRFFHRYLLTSQNDLEFAFYFYFSDLFLISSSRLIFAGCGFESKKKYLFGKASAELKLVQGDSAGTVTAYYVIN